MVQFQFILIVSDITSEYHIIAIFVIIDKKGNFHTKFVDMFMIYLHVDFHMPKSSASLVATVKLNATR